jgi:ATP-dependent RNA helicase DeaD
MLKDAVITEEPNEEDANAGLALLAAHAPEHVAAALVRLYRAGLPAPEEVSDPGEPRSARAPAADRDFRGAPGTAGAWFRLNVGRRNNADPKWLLPLICRRGNVTRMEIGAIRIFDDETAFEVSLAAAARFGKAVRKADGSDVIIAPLPGGPPAGHAERPTRGKPPHGKPPYEKPKKPFRDKASRNEPTQGKSAGGKAEHGRAALEKPREGKPPGQGKSERRPKKQPAGLRRP